MQQANYGHAMADPAVHKKQMKDMCEMYDHYFVQVEGTDGNIYEGIIVGSDNDSVTLLIPSGDMEADNNVYRQYPYGGYGYGYPRRFRRFRRHRFPYFFLRRLFFPFFF